MQKSTHTVEELNNLREFECAHMFTEYGKIIVQRTDGDNGAASACIMVEEFDWRTRNVKCMSPREAFEVQLAVLKAAFEKDAEMIEAASAAKTEYKPNITSLRNKVAQIQNSNHVKSVEIAFEYKDGERRFYTAITNDTGFQHKYRVMVTTDSDGSTFAKCNCIANSRGLVCRHVQKVAALDAAQFNRTVHVERLAEYSAHRRAA